MRPVGVTKRGKWTETFVRQSGYLPRPPTSTQATEILHAGSCDSCPGSSYSLYIWSFLKICPGVSELWGRPEGSKITVSLWQQLVLYYRDLITSIKTFSCRRWKKSNFSRTSLPQRQIPYSRRDHGLRNSSIQNPVIEKLPPIHRIKPSVIANFVSFNNCALANWNGTVVAHKCEHEQECSPKNFVHFTTSKRRSW